MLGSSTACTCAHGLNSWLQVSTHRHAWLLRALSFAFLSDEVLGPISVKVIGENCEGRHLKNVGLLVNRRACFTTVLSTVRLDPEDLIESISRPYLAWSTLD